MSGAPPSAGIALDNLDLDPHDFRVYAHIAAHATEFRSYVESLAAIASICRMGTSRTREALRNLERRGLIRCETEVGAENGYLLGNGAAS